MTLTDIKNLFSKEQIEPLADGVKGLLDKKGGKKEENEKVESGVNRQLSRTIFSEDHLKDRLAPDAANPNALDYFTVCDMGQNVYIRSFYIEEMPKRVTFATTFAPLFNTPHVTSSVFINPMVDGKASRMLDKKILGDETEILGAQKAGDRNKERKLQQVLARDEQWAMQIESGNNKLYEVGFLFSLKALNLEELNLKSADFVSKAKENSIELCSCYGNQAEAYLTNGPYNRVYNGPLGMFKSSPVKLHPFDKFALATIFNHTNTYFSHSTGIIAGRNMMTGEPIIWDAYAQSHNGYSCAFAGMTGTGKSATIKMYIARFSHFGYRFACIDTDKSGGRGEYSNVCDAVGGVNFCLKTNSPNRLNIFEIDEQIEYDPRLDSGRRALHLANKSADVCNILMTAITGTKALPEFNTYTYIEKIIKDCVVALYEQKGIFDGQPDSLYETANIVQNGRVSAGKRKKALPVMSDAYLWIAKQAALNQNELHVETYQILLDSLADLIDNLYFDAQTFTRVDAAEYAIRDVSGRQIVHVQGTKGYFDGLSTVGISRNTPFINIDISDLPDSDKLLGQQVAMNFLMENFIKKNSENSKDAQKIVLIVDEAHREFPYDSSRRFLADQVRTARKNNASMWICTQNLKDYDVAEETRTILKQVASTFILKQNALDRKFLLENTVLTESAVSKVLSLGGDPNEKEDKAHKGEVCLIDMDKVVFMKVDYLVETEAAFVETDISKIQQMNAAM